VEDITGVLFDLQTILNTKQAVVDVCTKGEKRSRTFLPPPFRCQFVQCYEVFPTEADLQNHEVTCSNSPEFCHHCGHVVIEYKNHFVVCPNNPNCCTVCSAMFGSALQLKGHMNSSKCKSKQAKTPLSNNSDVRKSYSSMTVANLRDECSSQDLLTTGRKQQLIDRLQEGGSNPEV
jgi:hypothetical protein